MQTIASTVQKKLNRYTTKKKMNCPNEKIVPTAKIIRKLAIQVTALSHTKGKVKKGKYYKFEGSDSKKFCVAMQNIQKVLLLLSSHFSNNRRFDCLTTVFINDQTKKRLLTQLPTHFSYLTSQCRYISRLFFCTVNDGGQLLQDICCFQKGNIQNNNKTFCEKRFHVLSRIVTIFGSCLA